MLTAEQLENGNANGYFIIRSFAPSSICAAMLSRAIELARKAAPNERLDNRILVMPEARVNGAARNPEDYVSKIFRLHRDTVFQQFCESPAVLDLVEAILGPDLDTVGRPITFGYSL